MDKKPRYSVMLDGDRTVYSGNSRFVAWTFWLMNRHRRAIAYDCGVWVVEPAGTVAKLAMRQPFVLFKGLTFQKLCLPGAFRPG
ncbi:hypothetical protein C7D73_22085, partial (plasmid) [Klebsiella pneumoniae]